MCNVVLVHPDQDATAAVNRYADYWSNRGQTVAVAWLEESGIKIGCFDYLRRIMWATELIDVIEGRRFGELPDLMTESVRRLVIAVVSCSGWQQSPFLRSGAPACVLVEPSPNQLLGAYERLKHLACAHADQRLSCFVQEALSARQATELSTRLQHVGQRFLGCDIQFEGFSLCEPWPSSNLVVETFVSNEGNGMVDDLQGALLACFDSLAEEDTPQSVEEPAMDNVLAGRTEEQRVSPDRPSVLPVVRPITIDRPIEGVTELDQLVGEVIERFCDDAVDSWPIHSASDVRYCLRWAQRSNGARSIVVSALDCPNGALERAAAQLYPPREDDEIIVLARCLTTDYRKAAQNLSASARLYELSQLPAESVPALLLKEVTTAVG